jgi:hypothetical protein
MSSRRFVLLLACALAACEPTSPESAPSITAPAYTASSGPRPLWCPSAETSWTTSIVTPLGGLVTLGGHSMLIPGGRLLEPTPINLMEPASRFMVMTIRAGAEEHFQFEGPILVTISYARCAPWSVVRPLQVWLVDPDTHELIENMGGFDNKLTRTVTFWTDHLSGYAIAE